MKKALITGVTGQDGSYLSELLLEKGYEVYGLRRRSSVFNEERVNGIKKDNFHLLYGEMTDSLNLLRIVKEVEPDEIYNLAAQSHVGTSWKIPEYTVDTDALGVMRILEAIRILGLKTRFYQASTSELFSGDPSTTPQNENTPFEPQSPYGISKLFGYWITRAYRKGYGMFCCNGILFNHESPRRGENFVTRKITLAASRISLGLQEKLELGNLNAKRDWGHAKDYVEMMWRMLQADTAEDYVISTGKNHSVREFCEIAFEKLGFDLRWEGEGVEEKGIDKKTGKALVEVNPEFFRPKDVEELLGDPSKAKEKLGWTPNISFQELVEEMVESDLKKAKKELLLKEHAQPH